MVDLVSNHPGCTCDHKWDGDHCEFEKGVLFDDALDLFQQRQIEIASQRRFSNVVVAPNSVTQEGGSKLHLLYIVSACVAVIATILFFASRRSKRAKERPVSNDAHFLNEHLGFESIENSSNVNLSPRSDSLDEVDPWSRYDKGVSTYAPITHSNDLDLVETLDVDTCRMIEARLDESIRSTTHKEGQEDHTPFHANESTVDYDNEEDAEYIPRIAVNSGYIVECPPSDCMSECSKSRTMSLDGFESDDDVGMI
jgi:hypothetical protein